MKRSGLTVLIGVIVLGVCLYYGNRHALGHDDVVDSAAVQAKRHTR